MTEPTPPIAPSSATPDAVQRELNELKRHVRDVARLQMVGRAWVYGTTLLVIVMFTVFSWGTYKHIVGNFDLPSIQRALDEHGKAVRPAAEQMLMATYKTVLPTYRDTIVATLRRRGPDTAKAAVDQLKQVPESTGKEFQEKLAKTFDGAVERMKPELRLAFPQVTDERRAQIMQAFVADQIDAQNNRIRIRVDQLYTNDLIHMQAVLEKFDLPRATDPREGGPAGLERRFLHTMVALLDDQVDAAYAPAPTAVETDRPTHPVDAAAQTAAARMSPTTMPAVR
jgi:hypothetical protein